MVCIEFFKHQFALSYELLEFKKEGREYAFNMNFQAF